MNPHLTQVDMPKGFKDHIYTFDSAFFPTLCAGVLIGILLLAVQNYLKKYKRDQKRKKIGYEDRKRS